MSWQIRIIAALIFTAVVFSAGWKVKGWKDESEAAAIDRAVGEAVKAYRESEANVAATLELKLQDLKANERVVERETIKLIDRPVYRSECVDADGLQLIERARRGTEADTGKPNNEVR